MGIQPPGTIGRAIYDARTARGWTRPQLARLINDAASTASVTQHYVYRWETGRRTPDDYLSVIADVLNLDPVAVARVSCTLPLQPEPAQPLENDEMLRRSLLGGIAATAAHTATSGPLHRLTAALSTSPLDRTEVERLTAATAALYTDEENTPTLALLGRVSAHLDTLTGAIPRAGKHRNDLIVAAGETAALAGWLAWDIKRFTEATDYYEAARAAAREAGHPPLDSLVLTYASYGVTDPRTAADFLIQAQKHVKGPGYATASAWTTARTAEELATLGDEHGALRALDRAEAVYDYAIPSREQPWVRFMRRSRLDSLKVSTLTHLRHREGVQAADDSLSRLAVDDDSKVSIAVRTDAASAYLSAGDVDRGIATARRALRTMRHYGYEGMTMGRVRMAAIVNQLPDTAAARDLRAEVQAALTV
ncbi:helix-turn-helix transcriptional regulator [Streptomyces thermoalcalitolerans]